MVSTIGLKLANGEFYSVVDENSSTKRRLILTTVHNDQQSVQIDLYKSNSQTMADAMYIGSLVMENIKPRPKGGPSIELIISSSQNGDISADAVDLDSSSKGEHQTLNVSLTSMNEDNMGVEIPDFELEQNGSSPAGLYEKASEIHENEGKRKFPWLLVVCAALILTAIGLVVWIFFFQNGGSLNSTAAWVRQLVLGQQNKKLEQASVPSAPPQAAPQTQQPAAPQSVEAPAQQPAQTPAPAAQAELPVQQQPAQTPAQQSVQIPVQQPAQTTAPAAQQPAISTPPPVIQAPVQAPASAAPVRRDRPLPPVASYTVPSVIPPEGVAYRIRYGDTLWDIAAAFYRNPWLYTRIARHNSIRNPDLIISGTTIRVPPRN